MSEKGSMLEMKGKKQVYNPYLPLYEYVPDGEPHVFGDRVYIYGSHDRAGGERYCEGNYVVWSAPVNDLREWKCEGVSYRKEQDPSNSDGTKDLYAPDVVKGADGRYYLYYCFNFYKEIGVAVSASSAGPFSYYGHVKYEPDIKGGKTLTEHMPFDPGVFADDDGRIWLYYGFSPVFSFPTREELEEKDVSEEIIQATLNAFKDMEFSEGGYVVELKQDMVTMAGEPRLCLPGGKIAGGTGFEGHGFFEASSMRKINGKYYYIYSSELSHELCYAVSDCPDHGFVFGGTIISNGDVGYRGQEKPRNMIGNNHGSIEKIGDDYYVFYHRQTHGTESSRQGCAEKIQILPDGSIPQVEMTSCGLNGGALTGEGVYPAAIACHLTTKSVIDKVMGGEERDETLPYIYEENTGTEPVQCIANIRDGVTAGYKYFCIADVKNLFIRARGKCSGKLTVYSEYPENKKAGETDMSLDTRGWKEITVPVSFEDGNYALYFKFEGDGSWDLKEFGFERRIMVHDTNSRFQNTEI